MEPVVLVVVVGFGVYAGVSLRGAVRSDRGAAEGLHAFAGLRGFREEPAPGPEPVREISGVTLRHFFATSPAERAAPRGSTRCCGEVDGLPLVVEQLSVRRRLVDVREPWTRIAVELPGVDPGLRVRPRTPWDVVAESVRLAPRTRGGGAFERRFAVRGEGRGWLGPERCAALADATGRLGRVEVAGGRLCLVRRGGPPEVRELDRLATGLVETARALRAADAGA